MHAKALKYGNKLYVSYTAQIWLQKWKDTLKWFCWGKKDPYPLLQAAPVVPGFQTSKVRWWALACFWPLLSIHFVNYRRLKVNLWRKKTKNLTLYCSNYQVSSICSVALPWILDSQVAINYTGIHFHSHWLWPTPYLMHLTTGHYEATSGQYCNGQH